MKKIIAFTCASVVAMASSFAQVLGSQQMKNTAWMGFGSPFDGDTAFYGLTDTFQARFDIAKFTIEGMLNWSFLANYDENGNVDNFVFGTSNQNPLNLHYGKHNNGYSNCNTNGYGFNNTANVSNTIQDSYYVNFLWHPTKNVDVGVGTKLNWVVGPAPRYGSWLWEPYAHSRQGGFSTTYDDRSGVFSVTSTEESHPYRFYVDAPGSADVVGFVPYANKYAKKAIGVRYVNSGNIDLEIGAAIPNGFNTDDPVMNFGLSVGPTKWLKLSAAIEGAFDEGSNIYTGATIGFQNFVLDAYLAMDSMFTDVKDDQAYGLGAAITFIVPNTKITLRPELGTNFFENDNYTMAWYTGASLDLPINREFSLNVWGSFAAGSKDERWEDDLIFAGTEVRDYDGGRIIDIRPSVEFKADKDLTFNVYANVEWRRAFDGKKRTSWSSGIFATYTF